MSAKSATASKTKRTKTKGKGKKKKSKNALANVSKADQLRLKMMAKALAYGSQNDMVDLERSCQVMSAATQVELNATMASLLSSEKLRATTEGRQARPWAGSADHLTEEDFDLLFNQLDAKNKTGKVDLNDFLQKCITNVRVQGNAAEMSEEKKEAEKRAKMIKTLDFTDLEQIHRMFPVHIQNLRIASESGELKTLRRDVHLEIDLRVPMSTDYLLDETDLIIPQRAKMALMGDVRSGKSTLFRAIAANEFKGFPNHLEVHHMKEIEVSPDAETLLETVVHANKYLMSLRDAKVQLTARLNGEEDFPEPTEEQAAAYTTNLAWVNNKLKEMRSQDAEEDAAKSLRVLGFDDVAQQKSTNSLSGGLRMRVALCAAFFVKADILLLDEPTNHLDFPSLLWLENRLRTYAKSFVVVCHDREILNNCCNCVTTINTDEKELKLWEMGFPVYEKERARAEKKFANEVDKFLSRNRNVDNASPAAAEVKRKREWLQAYQRKLVLRAGQFTFPKPSPVLPDNEQKDMVIGTDIDQNEVSVIDVRAVRFSYDPVTLPFIFDNPISIDIKMGTRMGVMGPNGAGKSTFLKLITGRLNPVEGVISTNGNATIAYFAQHHAAEMDLNSTPMDFMTTSFPEEKIGQLRSHLSKVGCVGSMTDTRMTSLSQGMRSCISFAKITFKCPSLLIMDEPTNFLDIETVDALIAATNKYRGALLLVSHSRLFLQRCASAYLSIVPGQFNVYPNLKACEAATYTFIAEMEAGGKVKMDASQLAKHGANATAGGSSQTAVASSGITIM